MKGFIVASFLFAVVSATGYTGQQHIPVLDPHGFQVDTPEVANAKAAHFAAYAEANGRAAPGQYSAPTSQAHYSAPRHYSAPLHAGPTDAGLYHPSAAHSAPAAYAGQHQEAYIPSYDNNGYQLDTPEVAHAKATHLAELAKANTLEQQHAGSYPVAAPYSHAAPAPYTHGAAAPYTHTAPASYGHGAPAQYTYSAPYTHAAAGPVAYGQPNGAPLDTPEVAQAKAAHAAAHAQAVAHAAHSGNEQHY